jgi:RNA polymerase sigma factor (sigma-70 family)
MGVVQDAVMGDAPAVEDVYRAEAERLWRALVGYSGSREIADDSVAEAFARALHHEDAIRDLRAWIWRVAFRVASSELRRRPEPERGTAMTSAEPSAEGLDLVSALRQISERQRLALVLHDYADRPASEVAEILGCSTATVYVHLSRGRRHLRELLEVRDA